MAVSYFLLAFGTMSPAFGAGDAWTLKFQCTNSNGMHEFEIKNTGDEVLIIQKVNGT